MNEKKGFTMIELLAVIVILAIISLIATPIVMKNINQSKEDSIEISLIGIERAALTYFTSNNIKTNTVIDLTDNTIEIKNDGFEKGVAVGDRNGVKIYFYKEGFCNIKENDKITIKEVSIDKCDFNVEKDSSVTNIIKKEEKIESYVISTPNSVGEQGFGRFDANNNTYSINVKMSGKNLLEKSKFKIAGLQNETSFSAWGSVALDNAWILNNLKPNTNYTISFDSKCTAVPEHDTKYSANNGFTIRSGNRDENGDLFPAIWANSSGKYYTLNEELKVIKTITTPDALHNSLANYKVQVYTNAYKKEGVLAYGTIQYKNIQIEEGSVATAYEPYMEPIEYTIDLSAPLRRFDGVTDEISSSTSSVIRRVGVNADGTLYKLDKPVYESIELPQIPNVNRTIIITISDDNLEVTDNIELYYK